MISKKKVIFFVFIAIVAFVLVFLGICFSDVYGILGDREPEEIKVYEGESLSMVLENLEDEDIILSSTLFKIYLKISGKTANISYGEHIVNSSMSYDEILKALSNYAYKPTISVRIPENANIPTIASILEQNKICKKEDFLAACRSNEYTFSLKNDLSNNVKIAYKLEGYLSPNTYLFYENDDPLRVLNVMLSETEKIFGENERARATELGLSVNELFTFASVVEGECCGNIEDMPKVAKVFWNRLNNWGKDAYLQSDITGYYPYNTEYYNTYENAGLPPGPINCITKNSLNAVLYPDEETTAYFFVSDKDMKFHYNNTLAAHEATIQKLKREGKWAYQ